MSHNIINFIQKTSTELGNMVIFGTNIWTSCRYICYLDIFRFLYIRTKLIQTQNDSTQNQQINL